MEMIQVSSSAICAIGYDQSTRQMRITFEQGDSYNFCGVPLHVYEALMRSSSKGTYYNDHIRDRYQCF
jgi:hypothetical protein